MPRPIYRQSDYFPPPRRFCSCWGERGGAGKGGGVVYPPSPSSSPPFTCTATVCQSSLVRVLIHMQPPSGPPPEEKIFVYIALLACTHASFVCVGFCLVPGRRCCLLLLLL